MQKNLPKRCFHLSKYTLEKICMIIDYSILHDYLVEWNRQILSEYVLKLLKLSAKQTYIITANYILNNWQEIALKLYNLTSSNISMGRLLACNFSVVFEPLVWLDHVVL